jgi:sugar/nucleoside kinase (ribokinase family)
VKDVFDLVGVGNPVYDSIITPFSRTNGRVLSGCSTNACLAAKRLGVARVGLVGCIGPDYEAKFRTEMNDFGIEVSADTSGTGTGGFHLVYDEKGDRTLDVLGVAGRITPKTFPEKFLQSRFMIIGPILGEVDLGLIEFLRSSTSSKLFLDPQGLVRVIGPDNRIVHRCDEEEFEKIAGQVDFIKPNEPESRTITGETDPVASLTRLRHMSAAVPIVTLAERGSMLLENGRLHMIPAYPTKAIDPTGAGDVYAGSFITHYSRTGDPAEASLYASAAASVKVEQVGPNFGLSDEEVLGRVEVIRGLGKQTTR